jgi:hypothetical protein
MIAAMVAALALALPASAAAQGAGDEQYRDPFGGQQPQQQQPQQQAQPQAPASPAAGTEAAPTEVAPAPTGSAPAIGQLPRTGFEGVVLLLASGWALLVGGAALRRVA